MTLSPKQKEVIRLMREGARLRDYRPSLCPLPLIFLWQDNWQKQIRLTTLNSLIKKHIIETEISGYYTLTDLGKTIEI